MTDEKLKKAYELKNKIRDLKKYFRKQRIKNM